MSAVPRQGQAWAYIVKNIVSRLEKRLPMDRYFLHVRRLYIRIKAYKENSLLGAVSSESSAGDAGPVRNCGWVYLDWARAPPLCRHYRSDGPASPKLISSSPFLAPAFTLQAQQPILQPSSAAPDSHLVAFSSSTSSSCLSTLLAPRHVIPHPSPCGSPPPATVMA